MSRIAPEAIASGGQGSFLDPPGYPTHFFHVETDRHRRKENRGACSLATAHAYPEIAESVRQEAEALLHHWHANRPPLDTPEVREWITQLLGYFRHCYIPENGSRNASDLVVDRERDPLTNADSHAGVAKIRDFYPEYVPTAADFAAAYWGSKP